MLDSLLQICAVRGPGLLNDLFWYSDVATGLSYLSIPISLAIVVQRRREDIPYPWLVLLFAVFIVSCGTTHFTHAFTELLPEATWWEGGTRLITAVSSVPVAVLMYMLIPKILALPSPAKIQADLAREVNHRAGNNLAIVTAQLRMLEKSADSEAAREALRLAQEKVRAVGEDHIRRTVQQAGDHALQRPLAAELR